MSRIPPVGWRDLVRVFERIGFRIRREKGDHIIMTKPGVHRPIVIPKYRQLGQDIIRANMRTAKLSREEFLRLLRDE
ncbi:MAG: type II toxin-antitoxin system HicA family toxin [Zetaproteobacteria bacterium]|nr:MAG: type II toxin-antitoxin system HicA family toxin [Zetaproteobacteria bacterium]